MSSQTTKAALRGLEQAEWLATSTETQGPRVSGELGEYYRSILPAGEDPAAAVPDFEVVQGANVLLLGHSAQKLRQADQAHRRNVAELDRMRSGRKRLTGGFKKRYRDERKSFEGTYDEEALTVVGLDAPPGSSYLAVREQLLEFRQRLREPDTPAKLGEPLPGHSPVNTTAVADAVDDEFDAYDTLMNDIRAQQKKTQESQILKDAAQKAHRRVVVNVARVQEGYYRLIGLDDLADRIRAARRRRKAKPAEKAGPPETTETAETPETAETTETTETTETDPTT